MEESTAPPLVFAHQVIAMLVEHIGSEAKLDQQGFRTVRVAFRRLGGSWFEVCQGSPVHTTLLIQVVRAWAERAPEHQ